MTARRRKEKEGASFEDHLGELQEIVAALEEGDLPLLESIEKYRAGISALKRCRELLDAARGTVEMLSREAASGPDPASATGTETPDDAGLDAGEGDAGEDDESDAEGGPAGARGTAR